MTQIASIRKPLTEQGNPAQLAKPRTQDGTGREMGGASSSTPQAKSGPRASTGPENVMEASQEVRGEVKGLSRSKGVRSDIAIALGNDPKADPADPAVTLRAKAVADAVKTTKPQIAIATTEGDTARPGDKNVLPKEALGAYDAKSNTILVSDKVAAEGGEKLKSVLREEYGEALAHQVQQKTGEALPGDLGHRVRSVLEGKTPAEAIAEGAKDTSVDAKAIVNGRETDVKAYGYSPRVLQPGQHKANADGSVSATIWDATNGVARDVHVTPQALAQMTSQTGPAGFRIYDKGDGTGYKVAMEFNDDRSTRVWGNFDWTNKLSSTETQVNPANHLVAEAPGHDGTGTSPGQSTTLISVTVPTLGNNVVGAAGAIGEGMVELTDSLGRKIKMLGEAAWAQLKEGAKTFMQVGETVVTGFKQAGQFIADTAEGFATMIGRSVLDFANDIKAGFVSFAHDVAKQATTAFASAKGLADAAASGLAGAATAVAAQAPDIDAVIRGLTSGAAAGSAGPVSVSMAALAAGSSLKVGAEAKINVDGAEVKKENAFEVVARAAGLGRTNFGIFYNSATKAGAGTPAELPAGIKAEVSDAFRVGATGQVLTGAPASPGVPGGSGASFSDFNIGLQRGVDAFAEVKAGAVTRKIGVFANASGALQWKIDDAGAAMALPDGIEVSINAGLKKSAKYSLPQIGSAGLTPFAALEHVGGINIFKGNVTWPNP